MRPSLLFRSVCLAVCALLVRAQGADEPSLLLKGEIDGAMHQSYKPIYFEVPPGTARVTVSFSYTGRDERTTIDLGLLDPDGLRGWSGGNKDLVTVAETDATPSYRPGPVKPGRWAVLLGIPNIRPQSRASYEARVYFSRTEKPADEPEVLRKPLRPGPAWFRGDLHAHCAHSDGYAMSQSGRRVPAPVYLTAEAAAKRGLDFVFLTDHNAVTQANALRELQPYFDRLLLGAGCELTTFQGHANILGVRRLPDFRVGSEGVPDWGTLLRTLAEQNTFVSINHPGLPSGESCMGCGWTPKGSPDYALVSAVEVVNGPDADTPHSGVPFWESLLKKGYRPTAIGGSDNHSSIAVPRSILEENRLGRPTTVVFAKELSQVALLEALRAGHAFIDVKGLPGSLLDFRAKTASQSAMMGDTIQVAAGEKAEFSVQVAGVSPCTVEVFEDGERKPWPNGVRVSEPEDTLHFPWSGDGKAHWLRVEVRSVEGSLLLLGNPIYVNAPRAGGAWRG